MDVLNGETHSTFLYTDFYFSSWSKDQTVVRKLMIDLQKINASHLILNEKQITLAKVCVSIDRTYIKLKMFLGIT